MKIFSPLLLIILLGNAFVGARSQSHHTAVKLVPATLIADVRQKMEAEPGISSQQLAQYANELLVKKGFDFQFDLCEFVARHNPSRREEQRIRRKSVIRPEADHQYKLPLTQTNGRRLVLEATATEEQMESGLCGECFFSVPANRVTRIEIEMFVGGRKYQVHRPSLWSLDEISLVDASMRRALRTWQVPDQTTPFGVSHDGAKLYLETGIDALILEISATSALRFVARDQLRLPPGEDIENGPSDPKNAYLSYKRFRFGKKTLILRYSAPCT